MTKWDSFSGILFKVCRKVDIERQNETQWRFIESLQKS